VPVKPIEVKPPLIVKPLPQPQSPRLIWPEPPAQKEPVKQHPTLKLIERRALPPAEFDREYTGTLTITRVPSVAAVKAACPKLAAQRALGCAKVYNFTNACEVFIVSDDVLKSYGYSYDVVWRHERAHCLGWRHDDNGKTIKEASKPTDAVIVQDTASTLLKYAQRRAKELEGEASTKPQDKSQDKTADDKPRGTKQKPATIVYPVLKFSTPSPPIPFHWLSDPPVYPTDKAEMVEMMQRAYERVK